MGLARHLRRLHPDGHRRGRWGRRTNDAAASSSPFNAALDVSPAVNPRTSTIAINRAEGITRAVVAPDTIRGSIFAGQGAVIDLAPTWTR
jgi:hypothetical protein